MIRKLRLKFICVNMLIVTVMLTGIFTMVYHFTREDLETQSVSMLQAVATSPFQRPLLFGPTGPVTRRIGCSCPFLCWTWTRRET